MTESMPLVEEDDATAFSQTIDFILARLTKVELAVNAASGSQPFPRLGPDGEYLNRSSPRHQAAGDGLRWKSANATTSTRPKPAAHSSPRERKGVTHTVCSLRGASEKTSRKNLSTRETVSEKASRTIPLEREHGGEPSSRHDSRVRAASSHPRERQRNRRLPRRRTFQTRPRMVGSFPAERPARSCPGSNRSRAARKAGACPNGRTATTGIRADRSRLTRPSTAIREPSTANGE